MIIFKHISDLQYYLQQQKNEGASISFIPTMGALHEGHISLLQAANEAKKDKKVVSVTSIFVNPTQFNDKEDFEKYPVSAENDIKMLVDGGCDVLFMPHAKEIYPDGPDAVKSYNFGYLETVLEGASRPGHFKGVGQVVGRLLEIVKPDEVFFGQKDYQQCMVIKNLLEQTGMNNNITMHICPTQREQDGLAMSSRNRRLTEPQRVIASTIYQCLVSLQSKQASDNFDIAHKECIDLLSAKGFEPEYVSLADADTLELLQGFDNNRKMVALIAAKLGTVRLIDNMVLN